jgi:hypothetical protein
MRIPVHRRHDYLETGIEILTNCAVLEIAIGGNPGNPGFVDRVGW